MGCPFSRGFFVLRRLTPLLLLAAIALPGCAPTYKRLPTLDQVPEMAALSRESEERRIKLWSVPVGQVGGTSYSIVAEETGSTREDELIVLVHGLVSDRTTWQFVAGHLGRTRRLWIPDQLGCGDSDRPDPREVGREQYSLSGSARQLLEALRQRNDQAGWPDRIVFVGHSLGGAVVLQDPRFPRTPGGVPRDLRSHGRIGADRPVGRGGPPLDDHADRTESSGTVLGLASALVVTRSRSRSPRVYWPPRSDRSWVFRFDADRIIDAFRTQEARLPTQAILSQAMPLNDHGRPNWETIETLVGDYEHVAVPVLLLWGRRDETLPLSMGYKLLAELPDARLRIASHAKHSLQADRPKFVAEWIDRFLEDSGAGWAPIETVD